jgi:hypothetical protein
MEVGVFILFEYAQKRMHISSTEFSGVGKNNRISAGVRGLTQEILD